MIEGMTTAGQEEYIWAMRASAFRESPSGVWAQKAVSRMSKKSKSTTEASVLGYQTKVMASLVPDEVIHNVNDYNHKFFDASVLFGDVSGFTELCEKYTKTGVSGPSRMTQVLNKYLGSMVQEIMSYNGDVFKFSGDAFLAMFKTSESEAMRDVVRQALDCALVIQKRYGSFMTDVGVEIRVKLAISCGAVVCANIGNEVNSHYLAVGKPFWDVKHAEHISKAGDIIVAPAAWHYVNVNEYEFETMKDMVFHRIVGVGPNWRSLQKAKEQDRKKTVGSIEYDEEDDDEDDTQSIELVFDMDEIACRLRLVRPCINKAVRHNMRQELRKYIIAPVMNSIDMDDPIEYLTEMRQVVICFVNVVCKRLESTAIIVLVDRIFKTTCSVVNKMNGCVNKVSAFDKDLMLVVIFGLRGFKNELECQVALRCARQCHKAINMFPEVLSTSIGVTTGKTYCGVFGHTLRREYTVIGLVANKAARLMVAYKNKVTCDKETFLHSKLEARHFILQKPKTLKGISHPGPVYEFREVEMRHDEVCKISPAPLLGRQQEIAAYQRLLDKCLSTPDHQYKMLLIEGEAMQGKTRLLNEIIFVTPPQLPVNKITLNSKSREISYLAVRLIFNDPLSLTMESTVKAKEERLLRLLNNVQVPDLLCVLNNIFGVDFKKSEAYLSMTDKERDRASKQMVQHVAQACFTTFWVLAIDNCEYIDDESWALIAVLFDVPNIFIVCTMCSDRVGFKVHSQELFNNARVKARTLKPIEKWYLGALACQILEVYAISPELENAIQLRSNGSPGWIESFLTSTIQDNGLHILTVTLTQIHDLGLVCPPLYMMKRLTPEEKSKWQDIMEERKGKKEPTRQDHWQKYVDSCRERYLNITIREQLESMTEGTQIPVCVTSTTFHVGEEVAELSMDAMVIKTFDSLDFFEQLLVKCSAILGNQFQRDMLTYVVAAKNERQTALAVMKLFEIRVLTCAKGDFLEGHTSIFKERLMNPIEEHRIRCQCRGVLPDTSCSDLPKYASCGFMQFRSPLFRDITYNLLTEDQKKEFHERAIRYLERETRRCRACGYGFFEHIIGFRSDREFLETRDKGVKHRGGISLSSLETASVNTATGSTRRVSLTSLGQGAAQTWVFQSRQSRKDTRKSVAGFPFMVLAESKVLQIESTFGVTTINKLKNSLSLTRGFSSEEFNDCQCHAILSTAYAQLVEHCSGAGDTNKMIEAMIEYSYICIILHNIPLGLRILNEALDSVKQKEQDGTLVDWKISLIRGKLHTLIGYSLMEIGHFDEALKSFHTSLSQYDLTFPRGVTRKLSTCFHRTRHLFGFYVFPQCMLKHLDHWRTVFYNNLSECLSHLCTLYMIRGEWRNAEMAASWSLTRVFQSFSDFRLICTACANMIHIYEHFGRWNMCVALEVHALRICHMKISRVDAEDLKSVANLYAVIFCSRIFRSDLDKAIHMGYIVVRMCSSVQAVKTVLPVLPLFIHSLLMAKNFISAYSLLQELEFFAEEDTDNSGRIWYYALCICLHLETGYTALSYEKCEYFFQHSGDSWVTIRDPDARKRYFTVMWLWCVRNEKWNSAALWCLKADDFSCISDHDSLSNMFTALYLLEGMILFLVYKIDRRSVAAIIRAETEIKELIRTLEKAAKTAKIILPRLHHLKAYFKIVKNKDENATNVLKTALKYAARFENDLEMDWIEHSMKGWNNNLSAISRDFWKEHSEAGNQLDFQDIEEEESLIVGLYTLPLSVYV